MNKILYATDFSENSLKALPYALKIAQKHKSELIMLHVFDFPSGLDYIDLNDVLEMRKQSVEQSELKMEVLLEEYEGGKEVKVNYIADQSISVLDSILNTIEKHKPKLLVVGTKGGSKLKELLVGSTTKKLVEKSPIPVLAIPENAGKPKFKKVMYATDFRDVDIDAIQHMLVLLRPFNSKVTLVHVTTREEHETADKMNLLKDVMSEFVKSGGIKSYLLLSNNIYYKLNSYIKENDFDLLVMLEKKPTGIIDKIFHQDLVKKMEFRSSLPLLSFNEEFVETV